MNRKLILVSLLTASCLLCGAQGSQVQMPQVIPPSPEAAAIAKGGQLSVGLFTGAPSAGIPFYEVKVRNISIPVGLNYSSNGTKVDEIPSRTGMGWILSAGGSVNRIVHGKPDDKSNRTLPPGQQLETYYDNLTSSGHPADNEPDEFVITAPGLSARFILDINFQPVFIPHANLKVQITGGTNASTPYEEFVVTNTEGVKYYFGGTGAIETTVSHNLIDKYVVHQQVRTSFFLKKIKLPEGEEILYTYSPVSFASHTGISQGVRRGVAENVLEGCMCNIIVNCPGPYVDASSFNERVTEVMYNTAYLTQITAPNSLNVSFTYENRPDGSGDKRLKEVSVQAPFYYKKFGLVYTDPSVNGNSGGSEPNAGAYNKRFFLTQVYVIQPAQGNLPADTTWYTLDYDDINGLPARLSFAQDYLGFYNGAYNTYFLPTVQGEDWGVYATADRSFRGNSAVKGMLKKITYPTGGHEEFVYEPNTVSVYQEPGANSWVTKSVSGSGDSDPSTPTGTWIEKTYYTDEFNVLQNHNATITIQTFQNPGCEECTPTPPNQVDIAWVEILNLTTNTTVWIELVRQYGTLSFQQALYANNTYKLKLRVRGLPNAVIAQILYNKDPAGMPPGWVNVEAGGVRVKEVKAFDPVSGKTNTKYYWYARLADLNKSSGKTAFTAEFLESSDYRNTCLPTDWDICGAANPPAGEHVTCKFKVLSSNSAMPIYMFDNNHMGYEYVVEADDPNRANGSIEHKFYMLPIYNRTLVNGYEIKSLPSNTVVMLNGNEITTKYFNAANAAIKEVNNTYITHPNYLNQVSSLATRRRYSAQQFQNPFDLLHPFDVTQYDYMSYWIEQQSTQVTEYNAAGNTTLNSVTNYYYGTPVNVQPARTETVSSKGETVAAEMKYPTDFPNLQPYTDMITQNVISPIIEQKQKNVTLSNKELSWIKNNYTALGGSLFRPGTVQRSLLGQTPETEITFDLYDSKGNILQLTGKDGVTVSYFWSYNQLLPVAKLAGIGYNNAVTQSGINLSLLNGIPDETVAQTQLNTLRNLNGALASTYTHKPHVGISMETDPRGRNTYYSYDNIGRLILVKDHDGNVLKKICYNYAGRPENCLTGCTDVNPVWQNTSSELRCQLDAYGQNTGYQEQEQTDVNSCSATYGVPRWVQAGYNPTACPLAQNVTITSTNYGGISGFTAVYLNNATNQSTTFNIPVGSGLQTLGTLPSGSYTLTISKPGNNAYLVFGSGCNGQSSGGSSATFYNVNVSASTCNSILIDAL